MGDRRDDPLFHPVDFSQADFTRPRPSTQQQNLSIDFGVDPLDTSLPIVDTPLAQPHTPTPEAPHRPELEVRRKLSRKLPPRLTESLEDLALDPVITPSRSTSFSIQPTVYTVGPPSRGTSKSSTPITPTPTTMPLPYTPPRSHARSSSSSTSTSLPPLTPSSSLHQFRFSTESYHHGAASCSSNSGSSSSCGTWSSIDDSPFSKKKESRREKKQRKKTEKLNFNVDVPPSMRDLYEASLLEVIDEDGGRIRFGDLVRRGKTIVVFIRHWFCPLCAQYVQSIMREVTPDALEEADVELIVIGNGSEKMLPGYKNKAMKFPFRMFTDPTLSLYRALGLTRQTGNGGPDSEAGDYLVQTTLESTIATVKRATQMPLRNPGHFTQLGGEFVFQGTLNVTYTHRMTSTRDHAPIRDVCEAAGVRLEWIHYEPGSPPPPIHQRSLEDLDTLDESQEDDWRVERDMEMERIKSMKQMRRIGGNLKALRDERGLMIVGEDVDEAELEELQNEFGHIVL